MWRTMSVNLCVRVAVAVTKNITRFICNPHENIHFGVTDPAQYELYALRMSDS